MQHKLPVRKDEQKGPAIVIDFQKKTAVDTGDVLKTEPKAKKPQEPEQYIKSKKHDFF